MTCATCEREAALSPEVAELHADIKAAAYDAKVREMEAEDDA